MRPLRAVFLGLDDLDGTLVDDGGSYPRCGGMWKTISNPMLAGLAARA